MLDPTYTVTRVVPPEAANAEEPTPLEAEGQFRGHDVQYLLHRDSEIPHIGPDRSPAATPPVLNDAAPAIGLANMDDALRALLMRQLAPRDQCALLTSCTAFHGRLGPELRWARAIEHAEAVGNAEGLQAVLTEIGPDLAAHRRDGPANRVAEVLTRLANRMCRFDARGRHAPERDKAWKPLLDAIQALPVAARAAPLAALVPAWPIYCGSAVPDEVHQAVNQLKLPDKAGLCIAVTRSGQRVLGIDLEKVGLGANEWLEAVKQLTPAKAQAFAGARLHLWLAARRAEAMSIPAVKTPDKTFLDFIDAMLAASASLEPEHRAAVIAGITNCARDRAYAVLALFQQSVGELWNRLVAGVPAEFAFEPLCALASTVGSKDLAETQTLAQERNRIADEVTSMLSLPQSPGSPGALSEAQRGEVRVRMLSALPAQERQQAWMTLMDVCQQTRDPALHRRLAFVLAEQLQHAPCDAGWQRMLDLCGDLHRLMPRDRARLLAMTERIVASPDFRASPRRVEIAFGLAEHGQFKALRAVLWSLEGAHEQRALLLLQTASATDQVKALNAVLSHKGAQMEKWAETIYLGLSVDARVQWLQRRNDANESKRDYLDHEVVPLSFAQHQLALVRKAETSSAQCKAMVAAVLRHCLLVVERGPAERVAEMLGLVEPLRDALIHDPQLRTNVDAWADVLLLVDGIDRYTKVSGTGMDKPVNPRDWIRSHNEIGKTWDGLHQSGADVRKVLESLNARKAPPHDPRGDTSPKSLWSPLTIKCAVDAVSRMTGDDRIAGIKIAVRATYYDSDYGGGYGFEKVKQQLWQMIVALPAQARKEAAGSSVVSWWLLYSPSDDNEREAWKLAKEQRSQIL